MPTQYDTVTIAFELTVTAASVSYLTRENFATAVVTMYPSLGLDTTVNVFAYAASITSLPEDRLTSADVHLEFRATLHPELGGLATADEYFDVIEATEDLANEYTYKIQAYCSCFLRIVTATAELIR